MPEIDSLIREFKAFGNDAALRISSNAINSYFHKLYNATRYEDAVTFSQIFTRIIVLSNYDQKGDLLQLLNQALFKPVYSNYSKLSIMQIILMAFLSGYYKRRD
ncbi:MAG: hypothetical protein QXO21_02110 [Candidatus Anstonellales archaeon]